MMPVVDASVGLSQNGYSISDYLNEIKEFHVIRMVAVQQQRSNGADLQELNYFQAQATTRGFGGFPNAIVASADLSNPMAIAEMVKVDALENLRGVYHSFEEHGDDFNQLDWEQSFNILAQNSLCLDVSASEASDAVVVQMAAFQPIVNIVVNLSIALNNQRQQTILSLPQLAKFNNVHVKICGPESSIASTCTVDASLIDDALELFGFERVMFASGMNQHYPKDTFDQLWSQYVEACSNQSAKSRDSLFRTNAIRMYGL